MIESNIELKFNRIILYLEFNQSFSIQMTKKREKERERVKTIINLRIDQHFILVKIFSFNTALL